LAGRVGEADVLGDDRAAPRLDVDNPAAVGRAPVRVKGGEAIGIDSAGPRDRLLGAARLHLPERVVRDIRGTQDGVGFVMSCLRCGSYDRLSGAAALRREADCRSPWPRGR
jgi:hypothetical protein